jgi:hypothetical protein
MSADFHNTAPQSATGGGFVRLLASYYGAAMPSGDRLGTLAFGGANDTTADESVAATISGFATQAWTAGSALGSQLVFKTTPNNSVSSSAALLLDQNQVATLYAAPIIPLTGYLYGNNTSAVTASTTIPGSAISGNISGNAANITGTYSGSISSSQVTGGLGYTPANCTAGTSAGDCLTLNGSGYVPNANLNAIPNSALANDTISGIALGSNLDTLTFGTHLAAGGSSYNGSAGVTITSDATNANTASTIVARDSSGNFSAGTITAALTGTVSGNLTSSSTLNGANLSSNSVGLSGLAQIAAYTVLGNSTSSSANVTAAYTVGTGGNDLVQLNASGQLPAVSGANLTGTASSLTAGAVSAISSRLMNTAVSGLTGCTTAGYAWVPEDGKCEAVGGGGGGSISGYGTLTAYDVYYMPSGGSLATALADSSINLTTNPALCVASSTSVCVTAGGTVTDGSWTWTVGGAVYVSDTTTGTMTQTAPSTSTHYIQRIGVALSATTILVMPGDVGTIQ